MCKLLTYMSMETNSKTSNVFKCSCIGLLLTSAQKVKVLHKVTNQISASFSEVL